MSDLLVASVVSHAGSKAMKTLESILNPEQLADLEKWKQEWLKVLSQMKEERQWVINLTSQLIIESTELDTDIKKRALWAIKAMENDKDYKQAFLQNVNLPLLIQIFLMVFTVLVAMFA